MLLTYCDNIVAENAKAGDEGPIKRRDVCHIVQKQNVANLPKFVSYCYTRIYANRLIYNNLVSRNNKCVFSRRHNLGCGVFHKCPKEILV